MRIFCVYSRKLFHVAVIAAFFIAASQAALAIDAMTVPWVPGNPLYPHDSWSGKQVTLKGAASMQGPGITYTWDFGDGSPAITGNVANRFVIEAVHTYTGSPGTIFTATLTVQDTAAATSDTANYYVKLHAPPPNLSVEANVAIDEGLWYLHKTQNRYVHSGSGLDFGDWTCCGAASAHWVSVAASNINAFEANGHLQSGSPDNPYSDTVARGLRYLFSILATSQLFSQTNGIGTFNPDANGNGYGVRITQPYSSPYELYQGGMVMDAIVSSGTPSAITLTGPAGSGGDPGILGRTYASIIQDMVDYYSYCQYDSSAGGGWRYNCNEFPDNSACQWAAIGMIAAQRLFGATVPQIVKDWNLVWLGFTQAADGSFGYTGTTPVWGPYATTPSGGVQMAMDGVGRGDTRWDKYETFMRDNLANEGGPYLAPRDYYYGLFSFTKSLLLHDSNADGVAEPIKLLQSATAGVVPIDWYSVQYNPALGPPGVNNFDGIARTLINDQDPSGYWSGHDATGAQYPFETAWAVIMLNRTVFEPQPVAVAKATPNPGLVGQDILFDATGSFHQDPTKKIVRYEWDFESDGIFDDIGSVAVHSYPALNIYHATLRVTDAAGNTDEALIEILITVPPVAPTASAGGPYVFCADRKPWRLDGRGSVNPDEGVREPGAPPDTIQQYAWDLDGDNAYDDGLGALLTVTPYFEALGPGDYIVQLRVTDTTAVSFPSSGQPNLSDTDHAEVRVRGASDPVCQARPITIDIKPGSFPNSVNPKSRGKIPVGILSTPDFDAPTQVDAQTLTFGRTGNEASLAFCSLTPADLNGDLLRDLVCHFYTQATGFKPGDTLGILKGFNPFGVAFSAGDSVRIVGVK